MPELKVKEVYELARILTKDNSIEAKQKRYDEAITEKEVNLNNIREGKTEKTLESFLEEYKDELDPFSRKVLSQCKIDHTSSEFLSIYPPNNEIYSILSENKINKFWMLTSFFSKEKIKIVEPKIPIDRRKLDDPDRETEEEINEEEISRKFEEMHHAIYGNGNNSKEYFESINDLVDTQKLMNITINKRLKGYPLVYLDESTPATEDIFRAIPKFEGEIKGLESTKPDQQKDFIDTSKDYYVVVSEFDDSNIENRLADPMVHQTTMSSSSFEDAAFRAGIVKSGYGRTKIAKLVFLEDERDEGDENFFPNKIMLDDQHGDSAFFRVGGKDFYIELLGDFKDLSFNMETAKKLRDFLNKNIK